MNEFEFIDEINKIKNYHKINLAIGDDTAILNENMLICSDSLVEGIHFSLNYFSIAEAVEKAVIINLSDILAMNGKPLQYLLNISIPKTELKNLKTVINSIKKINEQYNIDLIGGDTTSSLKDIFISVTMIGKSNSPIRRNGAKLNDNIYIGGLPGKSSLAMHLLQMESTSLSRHKDKAKYKKYHISPEINFNFLELFKEIKPNSMIDISDGLLSDLSHILKASKLGAEIDEDTLNKDEEFNLLAKKYKLNPLNLIYNGGEDFIPLFTSQEDPETVRSLADKLGLELIYVGKITEGENIINKSGEILDAKGFKHF